MATEKTFEEQGMDSHHITRGGVRQRRENEMQGGPPSASQSLGFQQKLALLVAHWLHHNEDHCAEFAKWREEAARQEDMRHILPAMDACLEAMRLVSRRMAALAETTAEKKD